MARTERQLDHVSRPLWQQMHCRIDRTRWPVLVTYSDEGMGHTGWVYRRSRWKTTRRVVRTFYVDASGRRVSQYSNGNARPKPGLQRGGKTTLQRWEQWVTADPAAWMQAHGWHRKLVPGQRYKSGAQKHRWVRLAQNRQVQLFAEVSQ